VFTGFLRFGTHRISPKNRLVGVLNSGTVNFKDSLAPNYLQVAGKILSYDFISERKIKDFITKRFYILKFDKFYLKFDFMLYNNGDKWTITSYAYNEDLIELLY
jgi:hypothetical protein